MKNKKGFTLVELAIVVAIISILAAIGFISYTGAQVKARDSKRATELSSIASALELYRADKKKYPDFTPTGTPAGCATKECDNTNIPTDLSAFSQYETNWGTFQNMMRPYMSNGANLPQDPLVGQQKSGFVDKTPYSYIYQPGDVTATPRTTCTNTSCYTLYARPMESSSADSKCQIGAIANSWGNSYICLQD